MTKGHSAMTLIPTLLILCSILIGSDDAVEKKSVDTRPNIILMLSDDQSWNGLSVPMHPTAIGSASEVIETPSLEKMAARGLRFSAAYAPASVCSPTHISLQTGRSVAALGWTKAGPPVNATQNYPMIGAPSRRSITAGETTIGEVLQSVGYTTAHLGKWHRWGQRRSRGRSRQNRRRCRRLTDHRRRPQGRATMHKGRRKRVQSKWQLSRQRLSNRR